MHRTRRRALYRRLIKADADGWTVELFKPGDRPGRLDKHTWCGGYRVTAVMVQATKRKA